MNVEDTTTTVLGMIKKASAEQDSGNAMRFSQAALNAANALAVLSQIPPPPPSLPLPPKMPGEDDLQVVGSLCTRLQRFGSQSLVVIETLQDGKPVRLPLYELGFDRNTVIIRLYAKPKP